MSITYSIEDKEEEYSIYDFQLYNDEEAKNHAKIWLENKNRDHNEVILRNCATGENIDF